MFLGAVWIRCGALPDGFLDLGPHASTLVVDRRGEALYEALSSRGGRSRPLTPDELPETLVQATLAAEDARFFGHPGVDPLAIVRAVWHNLRARRTVEGGSTLTQQVVKLLSSRRRTIAGKLTETLLALRLEHRLSKREILALYLSLAPYGNQMIGVEAASRGYFDAAPASLSPAQAALLAGLPQQPSVLSPYHNLEGARRRQQWVLSRMAALGFLQERELARARGESLRIVRDPNAFLAPHYVERILAELGDPPPRRVETSLDASLQRDLQGILSTHRRRLLEHGAHNVAVVVLDNLRAEWLAWEGSGDYLDRDHGGAIDGAVSPRQPGSAVKPFTYGLAFERGFTPASVLPDVPAHFPTAVPGVLYSPRNYDGVFRGPLRARAALAGSENVPAVWTLAQVGVPDLLRLLRRAGLTTLDKSADHYGFALTMGDAEVRLDELVAAYSAIARGGVYRHPRKARRWLAADGSAIEATEADPEPVLSGRAAFWVADVLLDRHARAYAFGSGGSLDFPFPVAVKTGTSQAYRDNWTLGFTKQVTVGVWVGNFDRRPLRSSSGVTGAGPIFHDVMLAAVRHAGASRGAEDTPLARPPDLVPRSICGLSGLTATDACPSLEAEWLPPEDRLPACTWHQGASGRITVRWPARYRAWARQRGLLEQVATLATGAAGPRLRTSPAMPAAHRLVILNPPDGATYLREPTLRSEYQTLPLRAATDGRVGELTWRVDDEVVGTSAPDASLHWPLASGSHTIAVRDGQGREAAARILVK